MAPNAKILFTKTVFILTPFAAVVFVVVVAAFQAVVDVAAALLAIVYS